jgi:hypothetical protein
MKLLGTLSLITSLFLLSNCDKQPKSSADSTADNKPISQVSEFDGDWVFVGLAHPWLLGDTGCAGTVSIKGTEITFNFMLSPTAGINGDRSQWGLIREGDTSRTIIGSIVHNPKEKAFYSEYTIESSDSDIDGMPIWKSPTMKHSIMIGAMDPPLVFRSSTAPPFEAPETPLNPAPEDYDPFAE